MVADVMAKNEKTGSKVTHTAAAVLGNPYLSKTEKSLASSALAQAHTNKTTSKAAACTASKALHDGRTSRETKSLAGSAPTQKPKKQPARFAWWFRAAGKRHSVFASGYFVSSHS